ncbi:Cadherin-89D [Eumeta japonica]|uniref:Cadherin-89D n=1 Tax=Eumeta variegata TaxID=151549 RepID=A0A4C1YHA3_EUMVA|nr:Cadherin-89D [Eumeta japonica]
MTARRLVAASTRGPESMALRRKDFHDSNSKTFTSVDLFQRNEIVRSFWDKISAYLAVTVYVEDVNDHAPRFVGAPYALSVDELTPSDVLSNSKTVLRRRSPTSPPSRRRLGARPDPAPQSRREGMTIFKGITAFDRDKPNTPNSDVQYALAGDARGLFALESSHRPHLVLAAPLDYDAGDKQFTLVVTASDRGSPPRSTNTTVHVTVLDNDDLPPKFSHNVYKTQIPEFYPIVGKKVHRELTFSEPIHAFDQDAGLNTPLQYEIVAGNERKLFSLNKINGSLFLEKEIDLDIETSLPGNTFMLQIQAAQIDNPLKTAQARVDVEILDLNDNLPEFEVDFYNISIVENLPNGFSVLQVVATDKDQGDNADFTYQLDDPKGAFAIDTRTGWLTVRNQTVLDRELHSTLKMKIYAKEKNPSIVGNFVDKQRVSKWRRPLQRPQNYANKTTYVFPDRIGPKNDNLEYFSDVNQLMSFVTVEVTLLDANDNNPIFVPSNLYEFFIKSNTKVGTYIGKVKAIDPDLGRNGMVLYDLQRTSNLTVTSPFQIDAQSGIISLAESPIIEGRHALFIEASDQPTNPSERRYSLAVVTIDVSKEYTGKKSEKPDFIGAPYEFWVGSNVGIGTSVGQIRVNDALDKYEVVYDLLHAYEEGVPFAVEERSGVITVIDNLTKFNKPTYDFEAVAIQENINITLSTTAAIHVVDVNDERGVLLKGAQTPMVFHVKENIAGVTIGQLFPVNISSIPMNTTRNMRFIIANQQDVSDDISIGQDGTIYAQKALDRERRDVYRMTIIAELNKGLISGAGIYQITINVEDDNDNPPIFEMATYEGFIKENSKKNTIVNMTRKVKAKDSDVGQNAIFTYALFGNGHELFNIDSSSGVISFGGGTLDREEKSVYILKIIAKDRGNLSSEAKLTINVLDENDNAPKFTQIIIPMNENIELLEINQKSDIKIYHEKKINTRRITKIEAVPKNKYSVMTDKLGPLFSVPENIAVGSTVLKLNATDLDIGVNGQVKFEFISETFMPPVTVLTKTLHTKRYFVINEKQGQIIVARILPPESEFRLNVSVIDGAGLSDNLSIRFFIKDINDHIPMFKKSWYSFNIEEAQYTRRILGKIEATDGDFGQNANLTYFIKDSNKKTPFEISPHSGVFSVNGELDREKNDKYILTVVARDNGVEKILSSSVSVEVQVLDINDNAPTFFAFDELLEWKHPNASEHFNHKFDLITTIPVYRATLEENSPIGTTVTRVYANDSDFLGNGNGLLLYSLPQRKNQFNNFAIDSKEGVVTTVGKLDYEKQMVHNVTVVASDLGSPSLSSTALLIVTITDVPEDVEMSDKPVFISRYYELEIEENVHTPVELLTLNVTEYYENYKMKYSIWSENDTVIKKMFVVDPRNGTLYLVRSPDREVRDMYEVMIRAERQKIGRELPHMIYPIPDDMLEGMTKYDVKVVVRIQDVNDNAPRFTNNGRPIVTAIPTTAAFGYPILQLHATDIDIGINADIRYQIINDQSQRFTIDAITGQVRAVASFVRDSGRVFGFDVKATDKKGADDGKSAIANVFVYVLDENKQLVLVMGAKPTEVERYMTNITQTLSAVSGYDVRVRRLEANSRSMIEGHT